MGLKITINELEDRGYDTFLLLKEGYTETEAIEISRFVNFYHKQWKKNKPEQVNQRYFQDSSIEQFELIAPYGRVMRLFAANICKFVLNKFRNAIPEHNMYIRAEGVIQGLEMYAMGKAPFEVLHAITKDLEMKECKYSEDLSHEETKQVCINTLLSFLHWATAWESPAITAFYLIEDDATELLTLMGLAGIKEFDLFLRDEFSRAARLEGLYADIPNGDRVENINEYVFEFLNDTNIAKLDKNTSEGAA